VRLLLTPRAPGGAPGNITAGPRARPPCRSWSRSSCTRGDAPLDPKGLIAAAGGVDLIIADRATFGAGRGSFAGLPRPFAWSCAAPSISAISTSAAASPGRRAGDPGRGGPSCSRSSSSGLGLLVDLSRGCLGAAAAELSRRPDAPRSRFGRQLGGSTVGIIGYGRISRARWRRCSRPSASRLLVSDSLRPARRSALHQVAARGSSGPCRLRGLPRHRQRGNRESHGCSGLRRA